jgi:Mg-chelatase subunit ChlD
MDDLSASLDIEVKEKKYERDSLKKVYSILERQEELFRIWDDKKEILYQDVRALFNSYAPAEVSNAWQVSGKALRELTDLDRDALFQAKKFYQGDSTIKISTDQIDRTLRDVIAKEYDNMKGIEKIGRNNGLCPYTPYEDLPQTSKQLSEHFQKLKPARSTTGYSHPYHSMVYLYNEIADDYNKFCTLSTTVHHLKTVNQPELFTVQYRGTKSTDKAAVLVHPAQNAVKENNPESKNTSVATPQESASVLGAGKTTVIRDTIYIEKRDTVYLSGDVDDLRSMEGYATNNMILLLDVSGSMSQPEKLPLLKKSMLRMLSMMRTEDRISIIAFSGKPKILLKSTSFKEEEKIRKAVEDLSSSGKTDGNAALKLAYKVADENYLRGGNNRIVLATDGEFVVNDEVRHLITTFSNEDIFLSVFNFGKGTGSSKSLETLATLGKGNYESISKENVELKLIREAKAKRKK